MFEPKLLDLATRVLARYRERGLRLGTAESCTGGLIASALTSISGASDIFEGGFVTYTKASKIIMVDVDPALAERVDMVSDNIAGAMAEGVLAKLARVDVAVSVTCVAGPSGGTAALPIGYTYFGLARRGAITKVWHQTLSGNRQAVRLAAVEEALTELLRTEL